MKLSAPRKKELGDFYTSIKDSELRYLEILRVKEEKKLHWLK